MLSFNSFFFLRICKINSNPKTNLTCQWLFYTLWYSNGGLGLINTVKLLRQTTETTTFWCTLEIFKHLVINLKPRFLHVFVISGWNYKNLKCIFIQFRLTVCIFLLILSSFSFAFFLCLFFLSVGSFLLIF